MWFVEETIPQYYAPMANRDVESLRNPLDKIFMVVKADLVNAMVIGYFRGCGSGVITNQPTMRLGLCFGRSHQPCRLRNARHET